MDYGYVEGYTWRRMRSRTWRERCAYCGGPLTVGSWREVGSRSPERLYVVTRLKCKDADCVGG
jgi:hypothetical protein